jgi:HK97 family phage prohead protease
MLLGMNIKYPAPDLPPATRMMIHGIASSERVVDGSRPSDGSDNSVMLARGCALAVPIPLLYQHSGDPIGKVVYLRRLGSQLYCRAIVFDNAGGRQVWERIKRVELRGLSCGFTRDHHQIMIKEEGVVKYFDRYKITEISIVHTPLNGDCYFRIYSGDGLEGRVAGQRPLSEIRKINDRAREALRRVDERLASEAKEKKSAARKEPSASPRRNLLAPGKEGLSPAERRRFDNWYQNSFTDDVGDA